MASCAAITAYVTPGNPMTCHPIAAGLGADYIESLTSKMMRVRMMKVEGALACRDIGESSPGARWCLTSGRQS